MAINIFSVNEAQGGGGGGVTTLDNGLTLTGTNGQLGGVLIKNTSIDVPPSFTLFIGDVATLTAFISMVTGGASSLEVGVNKTGPLKKSLLLGGGQGIIVTEAVNAKGLIGAADYSAGPTATNLAYIQKIFADANYAGLGNVVLLTTNQSINGIKTFAQQPVFNLGINCLFSALFSFAIVPSRSAVAYIDAGGALSTTSLLLISPSAISIGGENPGDCTNAANLLLSDPSGAGKCVRLPAFTDAQRIALDLSFGDSFGCIGFQTNADIGFWGLNSNVVGGWKRFLDTDDLPAFNSPAIVATNKVAGVSATSTLITYAVPAGTATSFRLNLAAVLRTVTVGTVTGSFGYTDSAGNAASGNFFNQGATVAAISVLTNSTFPPVVVYANPGTNITITITITGTILADFASSIERLN